MLTWEEVSQQFQQSTHHFDILDNPAVVTLRNSDDARLRHYAQIFDQSRSQATAVMLAAFSSVYAFILMYMYTVSQKNDTDVTHYRFNPHQPISVIFGRDVAERVCY